MTSFAHLTLILLLHYLVKCRSRSFAVYNNEFILGSACVGSENHSESTKCRKSLLDTNRIHFEIVLPDIHTVCGCPLLGTLSAVPYSSMFESK